MPSTYATIIPILNPDLDLSHPAAPDWGKGNWKGEPNQAMQSRSTFVGDHPAGVNYDGNTVTENYIGRREVMQVNDTLMESPVGEEIKRQNDEKHFAEQKSAEVAENQIAAAAAEVEQENSETFN